MPTERPTLEPSCERMPVSAPKLKPRCTVDEYLAFERAALERHLYLDGEIIAMAGESLAHAFISVNLVVSLGNQLKGKPCAALTKDMKVRSGPVPENGRGTKGMFSYPDVVVVCNEPEFHDATKDVILNPRVIVEILSESTEAFDRGEKFARYQTWLPTLLDYVLIAQDKPQVEHYQRQADGAWSYRLATGLDASVALSSIGCTLKLIDLYDRVTFSED